MPIGRQQTTH